MRAKWALLGIVGALALAGSGMVAAGIGPFDGGEDQPIAFPHNVHAGDLQIPCLYCHYTADRSPDAGIPPLQTCTGCHMPVGGALLFQQDNPELQKLAAYAAAGRPIPWVRIHDIPDHAHFPHMMHVNAGLQCQQCHGPVQEMAEIRVVQPLRMGWCIDCHQERKVRFDCSVCHY